MSYRYIEDLIREAPIPPDGILSRTLHNDERAKLVLFGFAAGQELSEHTAAVPAILHLLQGEARITLGADSFEARAGAWMSMEAGLPHSIAARTPVVLLLLMLKAAKAY